jgi:hypothetical protein
MALEDLLSVKQLAAKSPAFTESSIRWLIFNRESNGFDEVLVKVGRRVLIDGQKLDEWLEKNRLRSAS